MKTSTLTKVALTNIAAGLSLAGLSFTAAADAVTLNVVSFTPKPIAVSHGFREFVAAVNEEFEGRLVLNWRGGPEVMPPFRLADAVRNNSIDMALLSPSYYSGLVPSSTSSNLSFKNYEELLESGYYDRMTEIHAERGLNYLGEIPASNVQFFLFFKDRVDGMDDLKRKRIRVFPTGLPFIEALGANGLVLPIGEIYTAMERGAIDGFMQGNIGWAEQFSDVVNYYITPPFYRAGFSVLVSDRAMGRLPDELREELTEYLRYTLAPEIDRSWDEVIANGYAEMEAAGFEEIALNGEEAEQYLQTAIDAAWEYMAGQLDNDELTAELRAMLVD
ncbi:TRAP transporter substrate-binding protein DctP [Halomonas campisalis]|uniref:TRAP transporter substrate-binding protein DctP n=1 Tax=Billgrantia campisalis TaxID=74661 RepID=A0ABS9P4T6_9GAMM|nr:TRAP transporter substrate-binding protein DctP [Halomonas campisalis]MCG6656769.1 TRAP transporter substrate-binding protein DctP [Halomonas campisalis]MDR5861958.1 TRAP transporter substrate-binding protein DctP [Halomonas campisalis]